MTIEELARLVCNCAASWTIDRSKHGTCKDCRRVAESLQRRNLTVVKDT